jgi:hypothetical protein
MKKLFLLMAILFICKDSWASKMCAAGGEVLWKFSRTDNVHEQFHCQVSKGYEDFAKNKQIIFYNEGEMSSGFDERGTLRVGTISDLDNYYFDNYHDPASRFEGLIGYICYVADFPLDCKPHTGNRKQVFTRYG